MSFKRQKTNATIKIICRENKMKKNKKAPLYLRITISRKAYYLSLGHDIKPSLFDKDAEKVKPGAGNALKLNSALSKEKDKLTDIILDLQREGKHVSIQTIKERYLKPEKLRTFFSFAASVLNNPAYHIAQGSLYGYNSSLKNLAQYSPNLTIDQITPDFLEEYRSWMYQKGNKYNTVRNNLKNIRIFVSKAYKKDLIASNPFDKFKVGDSRRANKPFLTIEEVNKLHQMFVDEALKMPELTDMDGKKYKGNANYHDCLTYILIGIYTGLRFSDVAKLNKSHVKGTNIVIEMTKGKEHQKKEVTIPLLQRLNDVIELDHPSGRLYANPVKSNKTTNLYIRRVMRIAGIDKDFTFHCSRHTFAIVALTAGVQFKVISDLLGHDSLMTTEIYARVFDELRNKEMSKVDAAFEKVTPTLKKVS